MRPRGLYGHLNGCLKALFEYSIFVLPAYAAVHEEYLMILSLDFLYYIMYIAIYLLPRMIKQCYNIGTIDNRYTIVTIAIKYLSTKIPLFYHAKTPRFLGGFLYFVAAIRLIRIFISSMSRFWRSSSEASSLLIASIRVGPYSRTARIRLKSGPNDSGNDAVNFGNTCSSV